MEEFVNPLEILWEARRKLWRPLKHFDDRFMLDNRSKTTGSVSRIRYKLPYSCNARCMVLFKPVREVRRCIVLSRGFLRSPTMISDLQAHSKPLCEPGRLELWIQRLNSAVQTSRM